MLRTTTIAAALAAIGMAAAPAAHAGPDEYMGEIITVAFDFCPSNTLEADGRLLSIRENAALFSLLGTHYGGDGNRTFALPDLRAETDYEAADVAHGDRLKHCIVVQGIYPSRG